MPVGGVFCEQSNDLQNKADLVQDMAFEENVLQVDSVPVYSVQAAEGSTQPAPFVTHPVKKALQSELVFKVFDA